MKHSPGLCGAATTNKNMLRANNNMQADDQQTQHHQAAHSLLSPGPGSPLSQRLSRSDSTRLRPLRLSSQYEEVSTTCSVALALNTGLLLPGRRALPLLPLLLASRPPVRCRDSVSVGGAQKPASSTPTSQPNKNTTKQGQQQ